MNAPAVGQLRHRRRTRAQHRLLRPPSTRAASGLDLSGTSVGGQGAGGIGGLLFIAEHQGQNPPLAYHFAYDGNGNVVRLGDSTGATAAAYEYGLFGEMLTVQGSHTGNPFRFSTKYADVETGLVYYGYRYYNASTGRWLNRDPIEEKGARNLYAAMNNNSISSVDPLGLLVYVFGFEGLNAYGELPPVIPRSDRVIADHWSGWIRSVDKKNQVKFHLYAQNRLHEALRQVRNIWSDIEEDCGAAEPPRLIVLGFSNGGRTAVQFIDFTRKNGIRADLAFTVDPVPKGAEIPPGILFPGAFLFKPSNADHWVNHYQTIGILNGNRVRGATNHLHDQNAIIRDAHKRNAFMGAHMQLATPGFPPVRESLEEEVRRILEKSR